LRKRCSVREEETNPYAKNETSQAQGKVGLREKSQKTSKGYLSLKDEV